MKARYTLGLRCIPVDTTVQTFKPSSHTYSDEFGYRSRFNKLLLLLLWFAVVVWITLQGATFNSYEMYLFKKIKFNTCNTHNNTVCSMLLTETFIWNRKLPLHYGGFMKITSQVFNKLFHSTFLTLNDGDKYFKEKQMTFPLPFQPGCSTHSLNLMWFYDQLVQIEDQRTAWQRMC